MAESGINKVILVGNLGKDPEVKYLPSGDPVVNFSLATGESWVKDGQKQEKTEWHNIVMFRKSAEIAAEYLKKGSKIYLEGKLQTRKWQGQDGSDRYTTQIIADKFQMLDKKSDNQSAAQPTVAQGSITVPPPSKQNGGSTFDDDIPF